MTLFERRLHRIVRRLSRALPFDTGRETVSGSGRAATATRALDGVRGVAFTLPGELLVVRGEPAELRIEADDDLLPRIEAELRDGILEIDSGGRRLRPVSPMRLRLVTPFLERLEAEGEGTVVASGFRAERFHLAAAGRGEVVVEGLEADSLLLDAAGTGTVRVSGRATRQSIFLAGSVKVRAESLAGDEVTVTLAGSGTAAVHARRSLDTRMVGSGVVEYRGDPKVTRLGLGSGVVRPASG